MINTKPTPRLDFDRFKLPIDKFFLWSHGEKFLKEMGLIAIDEESVCCDRCGRHSDDWPIPHIGTVGSYSGITETHCTSCHLLFQPSLSLLGIDSIRGSNVGKKGAADQYDFETGYGFNLEVDQKKIHCSVCDKPSNEWKTPHRGFQFTFENKDLTTCLSCHKDKFEKDIPLLENKRIRGRGKISALKLGMMPSSAILCTPDEATLGLAHTEKDGNITGFYTKVVGTPKNPFTLIQKTYNQFLLWLVENQPTPPFIYINALDKNKDGLFSNLRVTYDLESTYVCSNSEVNVINLKSWKAFFDLIKDKAVPKKGFADLLKTLNDYATGKLTPLQISQYLKENELIEIIRAIPKDPHETKMLIMCAKKWAEVNYD